MSACSRERPLCQNGQMLGNMGTTLWQHGFLHMDAQLRNSIKFVHGSHTIFFGNRKPWPLVSDRFPYRHGSAGSFASEIEVCKSPCLIGSWTRRHSLTVRLTCCRPAVFEYVGYLGGRGISRVKMQTANVQNLKMWLKCFAESRCRINLRQSHESAFFGTRVLKMWSKIWLEVCNLHRMWRVLSVFSPSLLYWGVPTCVYPTCLINLEAGALWCSKTSQFLGQVRCSTGCIPWFESGQVVNSTMGSSKMAFWAAPSKWWARLSTLSPSAEMARKSNMKGEGKPQEIHVFPWETMGFLWVFNICKNLPLDLLSGIVHGFSTSTSYIIHRLEKSLNFEVL